MYSKKICDSNNNSTNIKQKISLKDSNSKKSLLALNSVLLSKIINKVNNVGKKLSSG